MNLNPKILANAIDQLSTYVKNPTMFKDKAVLNAQQAQILGLMIKVNKTEISNMFDIMFSNAKTLNFLNFQVEKLFKMVNEVIHKQLRFSDDSGVKYASNVAYNILTELNSVAYEKRIKEMRIEDNQTIAEKQSLGRAIRGNDTTQVVMVLLNTFKNIIYNPLTVEAYLSFIKENNLDNVMGLGVQYRKEPTPVEKEPEMDFSADDFNVKLVTLANDIDKFHIILKLMKLAKFTPSYTTSRVLPFVRQGYFVVDLSKKEFMVTDDVTPLKGCKLVYLQTLVDTLNINDDDINSYINRSSEPKKIPLGEPVTKINEQVKILDFAGSEPLPKLVTVADMKDNLRKLQKEVHEQTNMIISKSIKNAYEMAQMNGVSLSNDDVSLYATLVEKELNSDFESIDITCKECENLVNAKLVTCKEYIDTNLGLIEKSYINVQFQTGVHDIFEISGTKKQGFYSSKAQPVFKIKLI